MQSIWEGIAQALFFFVWFFRYLRTIVSIFTWLKYKPKPLLEKPMYNASNVTVIIPTTFKSAGELIKCLKAVASCGPAAVYVVTSDEKVEQVKTCCALNSFGWVEVLGVEKLNKRKQMLSALSKVRTEISIFTDDDVIWPSARYLDYLLAIFENPMVGAGGTRQRVARRSGNFWNFLGIAYLERRVWNNTTTNAIDGSISTLSGRTAAYRTEILKTDEFSYCFQNDSWRGKPLNSDDDKFLTRYVYSHGWEIALQSHPRAIIETTLEENSKYISQCLRWARAHFRGNFTVMENEQYWMSLKYWWGFYVIYLAQFQTPALLWDGAQLALLWGATTNSPECRTIACTLLGAWILFTKILKLIPYLVRHPGDLKFIPLSILFSYVHGFINIYAAFTLRSTGWGSQNLEELQGAGAEAEQVVPLLRDAMAETEQYPETTYVSW